MAREPDVGLVTVAYHDSDGAWRYLEGPIAESMPLRNLACRSPLGNQTYDIASLRVAFLPAEHERFTSAEALQAVNWYRNAYVHVRLVCSETLDHYRGRVRSGLRQWVDARNERGEHWVLVYLPMGSRSEVHGPAAAAAAAKSYKRVFDKIKSDCGSKGSLVKLELFDREQQAHQAQWNEFMGKLRDSLLGAFTGRCVAYDEAVRKLDQQRHLPGWNFSRFFTVKESLAFMMCEMGLPHEALRLYDEAEAIFAAATAAGSAPLLDMSSPRAIEPADAAAPVLDAQRRPYRDQLLNNCISATDLQLYLFARQSALLLDGFALAELAARALTFVRGYAAQLRANAALPPEHADCWVFSAASEVVRECEARAADARAPPMRPGDADRLWRALGELTELAAGRAKALSRACLGGFAPRTSFAPWLPDGRTAEPDAPAAPGPAAAAVPEHVANDALRAALAAPELVEELVITYAETAARHYHSAGRRRFAARLRSEVAALHMQRGDFAAALPLLRAQLALYEEDAWLHLLYGTLQQVARCERQLELWPQYSFSLAQTVSAALAAAVPAADAALLRAELERTVQRVDARCELDAFASVSVRLRGAEIVDGDAVCRVGDEATVELALHSHQRDALALDAVALTLLPADAFHAKYEKIPHELGYRLRPSEAPEDDEGALTVDFGRVELAPGANVLSAALPVASQAAFVCEAVEARFGQMRLRDVEHLGEGLRRKVLRGRAWPSTAAVELRTPPLLVPRQSVAQYVSVAVRANEDALRPSTLTAASDTGLDFDGVGRIETKTGELEFELTPAARGQVALPALPAGAEATVFLPVACEAGCDEHRVAVELAFAYERRGATGEATARAEGAVCAREPFATSAHCARADDRLVAQVTLRSAAPVELRLAGVELPGAAPVNDAGLAEEAVEPGQVVAFAYTLALVGGEEEEEEEFVARFRVPSLSLEQPPFEWAVPLDALSAVRAVVDEPLFEVELVPDDEGGYAGSFALFTLRVSWGGSAGGSGSGEEEDVQFAIVETDDAWMVSGRQRGTVRLAPGGETAVECTLLPLRAGLLPLPSVQLFRGCGPEAPRLRQVIEKHRAAQVQIFPSGRMSSVCLPASAS